MDKIDVFVSFTNAGVDLIRDQLPAAKYKEVVVIPHGHFINYYPNSILKNDAREILKIPYDAKVGLFCGRLNKYKGVDDLIPAFSSIASKNDWLLIAGEPESKSYEKELFNIAASIPRLKIFPYRIRSQDLQIFFNATDFCVYPFKNIFNSGSVIMGGSFAKPIVTQESPILSEIMGKKALFAFNKGEKNLTNVLYEAYCCGSLEDRGLSGFQRLLSNYSWDTVGVKFKSLYDSLI
jgi:glycosyltransferase involved in cell wall biosynthesis